MVLTTWPELAEAGYQLEASGRYAEALDLLTAHKGLFPNRWLSYHFRLRCAAQLSVDRALGLFRAALDEGYWFNEQTLRQEQVFQPLLHTPEGEQLVALCREHYTRAQADAVPMLLTLQPRTQPSYPTLLALHGGNGSLATMGEWQAAVRHGWLVAIPQSSQVNDPDGYTWADRERAVQELQQHMAALRAGYPLDPAQVVLAGFSMGGGLAAYLAISGAIAARGLLAVAPFLPAVAELAPLLATRPPIGLRGYVIVGEEDLDCVNRAQELVALLRGHGVPCELETHPGVGHWLPPAFEQSLARALAFMRQA